MIIKSITFKKSVPPIKQGFHIDFAPITIITGKQSSGKSLLLSLLSNRNNNYKLDNVCEVEKECMIPLIWHYDSEKDNPRLDSTGFRDFTDFYVRANSMTSSHGKTNYDMIKSILHKTENCLIMLDEPESGITMRNIRTLIKEMYSIIDKNNQIIIVTHHPLFMLMKKSKITKLFDMGKNTEIKDVEDYVYKASGLIAYKG